MKRSLKTRQKISETLMGRSPSIDTRQKMSRARKGKYKGKNNPNWKGGRHRNSRGYVRVLLPDHPRASRDGYVYEHIVVLEQKLGRPLQKGEVSHHINGILHDNREENLTLFSSNQEHFAFHRALKVKEVSE